MPGSCCSPRGPAPSRRNERERQRVRQVNLGFQALRQRVPVPSRGPARRLSKVQTLRAALLYIRGLQALLQGDPRGEEACSPCNGDEQSSGEPLAEPNEELQVRYSGWIQSG